MVKPYKKLSQSPMIIRGFLIFAILVSFMIIYFLNVINRNYGFLAYLITSFLIVFIVSYKYVISVTNWIIQGIILILVGIIIYGFIKQDEFEIAMGIYFLGIIISGIVNYKIIKKEF